MQAPLLTTARLVLRDWQQRDEAQLVAIKTDPENWRFIGSGEPRPEGSAKGIRAEFQAEWTEFGMGRWAVVERASSELLGDCGVVTTRSGPQLAYMIKSSRCGEGFATEAASAVLRYAFDALDRDVIYASTHEQNLGSRRVLEKLGAEEVRPTHDLGSNECWYELRRH